MRRAMMPRAPRRSRYGPVAWEDSIGGGKKANMKKRRAKRAANRARWAAGERW